MSLDAMKAIGGCLLAIIVIHQTLRWWDRYEASRKEKRNTCQCGECSRNNEGESE